MFKSRKKNRCHDTVRAEELQIGDRFVFNTHTIKVATARVDGDNVHVIMERVHLGDLLPMCSATLPNEMFITIERRSSKS